MPKNAMDYSKCSMYRIVCNDVGITDCYVGHTTNIVKRRCQHKNLSKKSDAFVYQSIRDNGGFDNWSLIEIEVFPCSNLNEALTRERYWLEFYNATLNKSVPSRTRQEWKLQNADKIKEKDKEYYKKNKDEIKEYCKEYRKQNNEKIKEYRKQNNEKIKEYRQLNKDEICEKQKEYYQRNQYIILEKAKAYRQLNSESIKEKAKAYRQLNSESINEKTKAYHEQNKDELNKKKREKRQRKKEELKLI